MFDAQPVVIGGNGHSGTRVFLEIIEHAGIRCGIPSLTRRKDSEDLRILDLLNRWVRPYVYQDLDEAAEVRMRRAFARRLRLYFPVRSTTWGFKNPRCMLILPILHKLFPGMKFVHVIRDGRDISLGNAFVSSNAYVDAFLEPEELTLPAAQKMILFWGRSNQRAMEYATSQMNGNYRLIRWEDLCGDPMRVTTELIRFSGGNLADAGAAASLVTTPESMGRWMSFPSQVRDPVVARGHAWLSLFGYK